MAAAPSGESRAFCIQANVRSSGKTSGKTRTQAAQIQAVGTTATIEASTPSRIEDYALIGDCETAALVDSYGSIDWLCWPDFSSDACFAKLLGNSDNGYWSIAPSIGKSDGKGASKSSGKGSSKTHWKTSRRYRPHTLILETTFESKEAAFRLIDFMPIRQRDSHIVRIVEGIRGTASLRMELVLRFDYGRTVPWVTRIKDGVRAVAGPNLAVLRSSVETHGEDMRTVADFTVSPSKRVLFSLGYGSSHKPNPRPLQPVKILAFSERRWLRWSQKLRYKGPYFDAVQRSLIVLRALIYRPTGGMVAAVTTSLPESLGGVRNWDYRYCWLRDTTFTLLALSNAGYDKEAVAWQNWLLRALAGSPEQVQIMYGLKGERQLLEWEANWLAGYANSRPVRVGNAASTQLQLDIYGEVLDCFYHAQASLGRHTEDDFRVLIRLLTHLEEVWQQPDKGIWETRGGEQQFTHSKMMAWVAFDRGVLLADQFKWDAPVDKWKTIRNKIHDEICERAFDVKRNTFVQAYGSAQLDAALLLMPMVGFLPGSDLRVKGTVEAIERELMPNGLVLRYNTREVNDGLPAGEGVFIACSYWMVSALKAIGREKEARALFERLLKLCNDVGLLSEEYDIANKRLVGNFPQAFSHISMVNAAFDLDDGVHVHSRDYVGGHASTAKNKSAKPRAAEKTKKKASTKKTSAK